MMALHHFVFAVAAAVIATTTAAEPSKAPARDHAQPPAQEQHQQQEPVVLASVEAVASPAPVTQVVPTWAPAKRVRTARVGNCRCGGQTPSND